MANNDPLKRSKGTFDLESNPSIGDRDLNGLLRLRLKGITDHYIQVASTKGDNELALNYILSALCALTLKQATKHYQIELKVEEEIYETFILDLRELNKQKQSGRFHVDQFWECPLVQKYVELFKTLLPASCSEQQKIRVVNYLKDYLPLAFTHHLSWEPTVRTRLQEFLEGDYHQAKIDQYHKDKYYTDLRNRFLEVTLNDPKGMTLDHIYQEPEFSVFERCVKEENLKDISRKTYISSKTLQLDSSIHDFINDWAAKQVDCEQLKRQDPRLILLYGFPGQGKTSFCRRLLYDLLTSHPVEQNLYFIRLRALKKPHLLKSEILPTLHTHLTDQLNLTVSEESLSGGLIILDGLDELFMKEDLRGPDVDLILQNLVQEVKQNRDLRILLTSRLGYLDTEQISSSGLLLLKLDVLDLHGQIEWLRAYRVFHPSCWLTEKKLEEINQGKGFLQELISQPILLHMIASLKQDITKDVLNKGKVYELLFEQITNPVKWKDDQIDILGKLEATDLRTALREIAFHIFISGKEFIHKNRLEQLRAVKDLKEKVGGRQKYFEKALKLLMVAFYLQEVPNESRRRGEDEDDHEYAVEFLHKSLQEYLTAEYIWEQTKEVLLDQNKKGKYIIDSEAKILEFLQGIFGLQPMSTEIADYLVEIINNDKGENDKEELATRLEYIIDYGLQKQFVYKFEADWQNAVLDISSYIFYGYWKLYSSIRKKIDLFDKNEKRKVAFGGMLLIMSRRLMPNVNVNLRGIDLTGVNLAGAYLDDANFDEGKLQEIVLEGASLINASFKDADLGKAIFYTVDCHGANLTRANLRDANLAGVYLTSANLTAANFKDANLTAAHLNESDLADVDFSNAILDNVNFSGALNLSLEQLSQAESIQNLMGVPDEWQVEVRRIRATKENVDEEQPHVLIGNNR